MGRNEGADVDLVGFCGRWDAVCGLLFPYEFPMEPLTSQLTFLASTAATYDKPGGREGTTRLRWRLLFFCGRAGGQAQAIFCDSGTIFREGRRGGQWTWRGPPTAISGAYPFSRSALLRCNHFFVFLDLVLLLVTTTTTPTAN